MTTKPKTITLTQLQTPEGKPTCSTSPENNCIFLQSTFGQRFSCFLGDPGYLHRYGENGYLIPDANCCIFEKGNNDEVFGEY